MDNIIDDPIVKKIAEYVVTTKDASISTIQREFKLGFNQAQQIIDTLENLRIVSRINGLKPRTILVSVEELKWIW